MDFGSKQYGSEPASPAQARAARVRRSCSRCWPPLSIVPNAAAEPGAEAIHARRSRESRTVNRRRRTAQPPHGQPADGPRADRAAREGATASFRRDDRRWLQPRLTACQRQVSGMAGGGVASPRPPRGPTTRRPEGRPSRRARRRTPVPWRAGTRRGSGPAAGRSRRTRQPRQRWPPRPAAPRQADGVPGPAQVGDLESLVLRQEPRADRCQQQRLQFAPVVRETPTSRRAAYTDQPRASSHRNL